jgi:hypothetical protein
MFLRILFGLHSRHSCEDHICTVNGCLGLVFDVNDVLGQISPNNSQVLKFKKITNFYDRKNLRFDFFEGNKTKRYRLVDFV